MRTIALALIALTTAPIATAGGPLLLRFDGNPATRNYVEGLAASEGDTVLDYGMNAHDALWIIVGDDEEMEAYNLVPTSCTTGRCYAGYRFETKVSASVSYTFDPNVTAGIAVDTDLSMNQTTGTMTVGGQTYPRVWSASAALTSDGSLYCATADTLGYRNLRSGASTTVLPSSTPSTTIAYGTFDDYYGYGWAVGDALGQDVIPDTFDAYAAANVDSYTGSNSHDLDGLLPRVGDVIGQAAVDRWAAFDGEGYCDALAGL